MKINKNKWHICKLCNKDIKTLAKIFGGSNVYYTKVFRKHLETDHKITDIEYFEKYDERPICDCGICNKKFRLNKKNGSDFVWSKPCGRYSGTLEWSKNAKINRCGQNNPMYKKIPWNKGKNFNESTKHKMRLKAIERIKRGDFTFTDTKPHRIICNILDNLNIKYEKEKNIGYFFYDIFINDFNTVIEVDGDYFHCNPKVYPDGAKTKTQEKAILRDKIKTELCNSLNIRIIRFWESDILNNIESVKCTLKKLFL